MSLKTTSGEKKVSRNEHDVTVCNDSLEAENYLLNKFFLTEKFSHLSNTKVSFIVMNNLLRPETWKIELQFINFFLRKIIISPKTFKICLINLFLSYVLYMCEWKKLWLFFWILKRLFYRIKRLYVPFISFSNN